MGLFDHLKPAAPVAPANVKPTSNMTSGMSSATQPEVAVASEPVSTSATQPVEASKRQAVEHKVLPGGEIQFSVGIDLGTTHCVLSYVDLSQSSDDDYTQSVMEIPQLTALGMVEDKNQLPSFLYQAHEAEISAGSTALPWAAKPDYLVGEIARNMGSKTPIRLVASAKSWLCHAGVDCKAAILPADAPEEVERVSPFQATQAYLGHLRDAWAHQFPNAPLSEQDLVYYRACFI